MRPLLPVAITGIGCLCAAGPTLPACMASLFAGIRRHGLPTRFATPVRGSHPVFELPDPFFDPADFRGPPPPSRTPRMALAAAREAIEDAGLTRAVLTGRRVGVCVGTNVGGAASETDGQALLRHGYIEPARRFSETSPAMAIAREYDLSGPLATTVTACSAGSDAIGLAAAWIRNGLCDLAIAGGADELYEITYNGFISLMNTDEEPCRPFDARRNGLNLGEGAAMMVLAADGSGTWNLRGRVLGYGNASDAYHLTAPSPDGRGLRLAVDEAIQAAGINPADLAFINAHGTGTRDNDAIEAELFAERFPGVPFLSTKGYTGHTLGAAGAVEAAFTLACLAAGRVPASAGFSQQDPDLPATPCGVVDRVTPISGNVALSQTLAFGGSNSVLVLGGGEAKA
jgi:3-oxoacyl-[acyl-carrier-protein] synthase II